MKKLIKNFTSTGVSAPSRAQRNAKLVQSMNLDSSQVINADHVQLGALLGEGGFAKVYNCKWQGQAAVTKVIPSDKLDDEMTYLLTNECTIWARLSHENISNFYGMCATAESIWLVCELLPGGSLQQLLEEKRKARAPAPTVIALMKDLLQLAKGMEYLHGLNPVVLHRDLKSANILLADDSARLVIADFGLARYSADAGAKMTAETGSYRWMAPEVIRHEEYDERCDVYSFAILSWEMLTYRIPFDKMLPVEAAFAVARSAQRPDVPPTCPPSIQTMLTTCWHQEAKKRPAFVHVRKGLEEELTACEADRPTAAEPE